MVQRITGAAAADVGDVDVRDPFEAAVRKWRHRRAPQGGAGAAGITQRIGHTLSPRLLMPDCGAARWFCGLRKCESTSGSLEADVSGR